MLKVSEPQRSELGRIRRIVRDVVPEAEEVMSYGMPGFKYRNKYLVGFAAFKDHLSLFPTAGPIAALKDKLDGFELSKGTVHFTPDHPISESLIKEILLERVSNIA